VYEYIPVRAPLYIPNYSFPKLICPAEAKCAKFRCSGLEALRHVRAAP
jgi:hypothetical protein